MTTLTFTAARTFKAERSTFWRLELFRVCIANAYNTWKSERARKANLRFIMTLDSITLRDLGYTREEIAARHDGPLPISRWKSKSPRA